jgi:hypothetical protein
VERKIRVMTDKEGKGYEYPYHSSMKYPDLPIRVFKEVRIAKADVNQGSLEKQALGKKQSEKV